MLLSKVYRGGEQQLRAVRFRDFDEVGDAAQEEGLDLFVTEDFSPQPPIPKTHDPEAAEEQAPAQPAAGPQPGSIAAAELEAARNQAFEEGRQAALAEAGQALVQSADALGGALADVSRLRETLLRNSTEDMLRLVMTIAEQVVAGELKSRPEQVLEVLRRALQHAVKADEYLVRVNPEDLALVQENKPLFMTAVSGLKNIRIEGDAAVSRGGCRVESELGQVEATAESQLAEIRNALFATLEEA